MINKLQLSPTHNIQIQENLKRTTPPNNKRPKQLL